MVIICPERRVEWKAEREIIDAFAQIVAIKFLPTRDKLVQQLTVARLSVHVRRKRLRRFGRWCLHLQSPNRWS